jgi:hypothetical protein
VKPKNCSRTELLFNKNTPFQIQTKEENMKNYPKTRQSNLVVQESEKEILIYDLKINKAFCLNETCGLVWQLCDGRNTVAEIAKLMSVKLKLSVPDEFVWLALDSLKKDDLLEKSDEFEINFKGLNRRQIIKKVGLASMIALPLISSVIAPSAVMAQSVGGGLPLFSACTSDPQCASGHCELAGGGINLCCAIDNSLAAFLPLPGQPLTVPTACFDNQSQCDLNASAFCCSGMGTLRFPAITCMTLNQQDCVCS